MKPYFQIKKDITQEVLTLLKSDLPLNTALYEWWYPGDNLRLTAMGYTKISLVIEPYKNKISFFELSGKHLIKLSKLKTPYFISRTEIAVFNSYYATLIKMYPSFQRFLDLL